MSSKDSDIGLNGQLTSHCRPTLGLGAMVTECDSVPSAAKLGRYPNRAWRTLP